MRNTDQRLDAVKKIPTRILSVTQTVVTGELKINTNSKCYKRINRVISKHENTQIEADIFSKNTAQGLFKQTRKKG